MNIKINLIKKIYPSLIIFGILSILLIAFVVWPLFKQIKETSKNFSMEKNRIFYLNAEKENIQKIKNIYKTYEPDLNRIETLFFNPSVPVNFIGFLEKTAVDSQVKLDISSMTKQEAKEELWPSLSLQVVISGSFNNTSRFLEKIENSSFLVEIIDLNAKKLTKEESSIKELKDISEADTKTILSIRVFTQ